MPEAIARRRRGSTPTCINVNCIVSTCTNVNCISSTCTNVNCIVYIICMASEWTAIGRRRRGSPLFGTGWCVMERTTAAPVAISTEHIFVVIVIVIERAAAAAAPVNIANATEHK